MNVACVDVVPYELRLREPLQVGNRRIDRRDGVLVRVESTAGAEGWGDAAPLPGFSVENRPQAEQELRDLAVRMVGFDVLSPADLDRLSNLRQALSSSARFAVETALVTAAAAEAGQAPGAWLLGVESDRCTVNALIGGDPSTWPGAVARCAAEGFLSIKLKVGRHPIDVELAAVRAATAAAPAVRWRLDANRAWTGVEALAFAHGLAGLPVDYVEEPLRAGEALPAGWPRTVGTACDESLQSYDDVPDPVPPVVAWVLKPTLAGGLARSLARMRQARRCGCGVVFSAAHESGVGIRMLGELAAATGIPAGLDTYRLLAEDVLEPRLHVAGGTLDLIQARAGEVRSSWKGGA
ncbi:MAG: o-succinylbenzoate synthase [Verrucomicrobia bacterium]|nr:o-succinylbenzoate synthase [Verrucomicrobiota bacterium]